MKARTLLRAFYVYGKFLLFVKLFDLSNIQSSSIKLIKSMRLTLKQILWVFCLCHAITYAQSPGKIEGKLKFPSNSQTVLVQLLSAADQSIVKTQISEPDGSFSFENLADESYIVYIDDENYAAYQSDAININSQNQHVILPEIILTANTSNLLSEVVVQKKKPLVENKIDKTVVNVEAMMTAVGGDAMDVLEKSPGILVDQNGTITLKGKSGVSVFIDGKPTYLSGAELEAYLKSLPASTLNQIELMTNPPAKYDAAGSGGVINIVTKKSKARGFNGSFTSRYQQARRASARETLSLNYLNDKVRMFGNAGYGYHDNKGFLYIYRHFRNEDGTTRSHFDQYSNLGNRANAVNGLAGLDYYATEKTTFGFSLSGLTRLRNSRSDVESSIRDANNVVDSTIVANNGVRNRFSNWGANVNFRHDFEKGKLTADADYLNYVSKTDQRFHNLTYQPDNTLSEEDESVGYLPSDIDIFSFKTDYSRPLKNDGTIEAGYKVSVSKTDNIADYRNVVDGAEIPDYYMTNHFKYDEVINAGYVNFNMSYRRFTFQTGLRVENTSSKGHQLGNPERPEARFTKDYTNFFPTAYVQYKLDSIGNHSLVTSYGKRINRPYYEDLNPFVSPLDKFTFYAGNPYLNPSFSQNFELSYRYKGFFSTTLAYGYSKDDIAETIEINDGIYYSRPGNIGKSYNYSWQTNAQIPFAKWLTTTAYVEVTHSKFESQLYTETLDSSGTWSYFTINNQFKFNKDWSAELSGFYHTDIVSSQFILGSRGAVNVGIAKKILKGQGTIRLTGNDIFYNNVNTGTINNLQLTDANWINKVDTRNVALTFTYGFGKSFQPKNQYDPSGAESEKNRVKGG